MSASGTSGVSILELPEASSLRHFRFGNKRLSRVCNKPGWRRNRAEQIRACGVHFRYGLAANRGAAAAERQAAVVHRSMARGLDGLATVAATAPFPGLFGTAFGMIHSFRGCDGNRASILAGFAELLSEALLPSAMGLAIAIVASAGYQYLRACLADFDVDMRQAARALPDLLHAAGLDSS